MNKYTLSAIAVLMLGASPVSAACTTSTPVDIPILQAAIDSISNGGANDGSYDFKGTADCPVAKDGSNGADGANGLNGKDGRDGRDFDASEALAISAALSLPAWLGDSEQFSLSGGLGFSDGETALGATGIARIDKNWSAFAGAAASTSGDEWAGKAGLRLGW
jgi:hypothetical protein